MYGYKSSATLTTDRSQYKLQTRPLVREGAQRRRAKQLSGKRKEKVKSGHALNAVPDLFHHCTYSTNTGAKCENLVQ
jgi:hypothetical protein